jgi:hypothetical protein
MDKRKHMRCFSLCPFITLALIVALTSCKKPKHGYWQLTLMDQNKQPLLVDFGDKHNTDKKGGYIAFHGTGITVYYREDQITDGLGELEWVPGGATPIYQNFRGTLGHRSGEGTYGHIHVEHLHNANGYYDSSWVETGTFDIKWLTEKNKRK